MSSSNIPENEREVVDPVTHVPLTIHDVTSVELETIPPPPSTARQTKVATDCEITKDSSSRHADMESLVYDKTHQGWWEDTNGDLNKMRIQTAIVAGCTAGGGALASLFMWGVFEKAFGNSGGRWGWITTLMALLGCCMLGIGVTTSALVFRPFQGEQASSMDNKLEKPLPHSSAKSDENPTESAAWLNSFIKALWPTVNPALFISISDMLEDSLQASLPKFINAVRVAELGQGSVPMRIIGIRWLEPSSASEDKHEEEGDFVNMEVSVAYRAETIESSGLKGHSRNAHLFIQFWTTGGLMIPVWAEITGILATARLRVQLIPNPPFLSLMTLTLLGQPKVTSSCTPLAKNFLNVMDVPGLSGWLQASVDSAIAEYVAPRSINLDLKSILTGVEKMDTDAYGALIITVKSATGLRQGDSGTIMKSGDGGHGHCYVTVGWSKLGKPLWSTRIIQGEGDPVWEETTALLVSPTEVNAKEEVRLQLWDSDRFTADDLLGMVDLSLYDLMKSPDTLNSISNREDALAAVDGSSHPGKLSWRCGYFSKTTLQQHMGEKQEGIAELEANVKQEAEDKLREARNVGGSHSDKVEQQQREDLKEKTNEIILSSRPAPEWPSGILSIRIEQISGLEVQKIRESGVKKEGNDGDSDADDLPSPYCTVILNHQKVYKTRTKMKSNEPFFDATTEKFIRDWKTTVMIVAVSDSRMHESDPLLGVLVLPLTDVFKNASRFDAYLPLVGGIGYGRVKFTLTFRSVQAKIPKQLLGWDVGTLDIEPVVKGSIDIPADLATCRLIFWTSCGKGKVIPSPDGGWKQKRGQPIRLAVKDRYASCMLIELRKHALGPDKIPAFAILWLKDIPDEENIQLSLPLWKNDHDELDRARTNAIAEHGQTLGTLDVTLRFWSGLSGYHHKVANRDRNMKDVIEALDCGEASKEVNQGLLNEQVEECTSDSSSSSSDEDENEGGEESGTEDKNSNPGVVGRVKDYKKREGELHRKHRGLMQWKVARNIAWIGEGIEHKVDRLEDKIKGSFKHQPKTRGIEKEV